MHIRTAEIVVVGRAFRLTNKDGHIAVTLEGRYFGSAPVNAYEEIVYDVLARKMVRRAMGCEPTRGDCAEVRTLLGLMAYTEARV